MTVTNLPKQFSDNSQVSPAPTGVLDSRIHQRLGELIETLVKDSEIGSERELGRITNLSHAALRNWSSLTSDPQLLKLIKFAYGIGWSMSELMSFAEGDEDVQEAILRKKQAKERLQSSRQASLDKKTSQTDTSVTSSRPIRTKS